MENMEYAIAYSEVLEILKYISLDEYSKIPSDKIKMFEENAIKDYQFNYNPNLTLNEQNVSKRAKAIIAILFRDYWATDIQREKIETKQKYDRIKIEDEKKEKYNPDNIFNNRKTENVETVAEPVAMIEYRESFFSRIINKIKNIFRRK